MNRLIENSSLDVFVLTRCAEALDGERHNLESEEWVENQVRFLEEFSKPSLLAQSDFRFEWLVSVSDLLPPTSLSKISRAVAPVGKVVMQRGGEHSSEVFFRELCAKTEPYVTVLFDYDDVLHPKFVEKVRASIAPGKSVYSFVSGIAYDRNLQIAAKWPHVSNPFIFCLGERGSNVFGLGNHTRVEAKYREELKVIHTLRPMWVKIYHGKNMGGDEITNADRPLFSSRYLNEFSSGNFSAPFVAHRDLGRVLAHIAIALTKSLQRSIGLLSLSGVRKRPSF